MDYWGVETIKTADQGCVWLFGCRFDKVRWREISVRPIGSIYARSVCDTQAPLQLRYAAL